MELGERRNACRLESRAMLEIPAVMAINVHPATLVRVYVIEKINAKMTY